jgi:predicted nucleic acid-binding protein
VVIVDTSFLLAFLDSDEPANPAVARAVETAEGPFVLSPYVVAEIDYLVLSRLGVDAELALLRQLGGGEWDLATFTAIDFAAAADIVEKYRDQSIGITDASLVALADRLKTRTIATLDRRHFTVLRNRAGQPFRLIP